MNYEERLAAAVHARAEAYGRLGTPDPMPLVAQVEEGPPFWPGSRAYQWIWGDDHAVLASYGLSDPWPDAPGRAGYGVEVVLEVARGQAQAPWVFALLARVAEGVVRRGPGALRAQLDALGTLSNEVLGELFPSEWRSATGRVGVLLGCASAEVPRGFSTPDGEVRIVPVTLLWPAELAGILVREGARDEIAAELAARPRGHASRLDRAPTTVATPHAPYEPAPSAKKPWWKLW